MFSDTSTTVLIVLLAMAAFLLGVLIWLRKTPVVVACREPLFKPESRSFLGQLDIAVRSHLMIFPSMSVIDVVEASRFSKGALALRRVSKQRFDYVLCNRKEMEVLCVIKLLPYGKNSDNKEMKALREVCNAAGLTLLEYEMKPYRNVLELRKVVLSACGIDELEAQEHGLAEAPKEEFQAIKALETPEDSPECPKCSASMKLTTIKKGSRAGQECWICSTYPNCKGARLLTPETV